MCITQFDQILLRSFPPAKFKQISSLQHNENMVNEYWISLLLEVLQDCQMIMIAPPRVHKALLYSLNHLGGDTSSQFTTLFGLLLSVPC